jgi:hypothetical protein
MWCHVSKCLVLRQGRRPVVRNSATVAYSGSGTNFLVRCFFQRAEPRLSGWVSNVASGMLW